MRKILFAVVALLIVSVAPLRADNTVTSISITNFTAVKRPGVQLWDVTCTGTTTLAANAGHIAGFQFYFRDGNMNQAGANVTWTQPTPGQTTNFSISPVTNPTAITGKWFVFVQITDDLTPPTKPTDTSTVQVGGGP
jgi:hypothetical protein